MRFNPTLMKVLDRYVSSQILISLGFGVGILSVVLVLGQIFKRLFLLMDSDVPIDFILSFIAWVMPFSLTFTIPWGFLTAILLVFGRLSAENELTAMRATGVSILRISAPVLVLGVLLSMLCLWINVDVAPKAQQRMKNAIFEIATSNPAALFGSDSVIEEFPGRKIYVGEKNGSKLGDILIFELNEASLPTKVVHAKRGELQTEDAGADGTMETKQVKLRLFDAMYEENDPAHLTAAHKIRHGITMQEGVVAISLKELYEKKRKKKGLSSMTLSEINTSLDGKSDAEMTTAGKTEINKRFSFSLACLAFALIAVPLGITAHRRETSIGFAISLGVALTYFLFIIIADTFRNDPAAMPYLLVWVPNVLFIGLGIFLFRRLMKQ